MLKRVLIVLLVLFSHLGLSLASTSYSANLRQRSVEVADSSHQNSRRPLSISGVEDTLSPCQLLYNKALSYEDNSYWQMAYDTAKQFVEHCDVNYASRAFNIMAASLQYSNIQDTNRYERFRDWLKSILYTNTKDQFFYCNCVRTIAGTFKTANQSLSVIQWLLLNTNCEHDQLWQDYTSTRESQRELWLAGDTSKPLDTTLPSIHDLGLDVILLHSGVLPTSSHSVPKLLVSAEVAANPFTKSTELDFELTASSYAQMDITDLLGNVIATPQSERTFEAGRHRLEISGDRLASGSYFLRMHLSDGEVRTFRIVKE